MFTPEGRLDTARFSRGLQTSLSEFYAVLTACTETYNEKIKPSHFLMAMTKIDKSLTQKAFLGQGLEPEIVAAGLQDEITVPDGEVPLNLDLTRDFFSSEALAMLEELENLANGGGLTEPDESTLLFFVLRHLEPGVREELFDGIIDLDAVIRALEPSAPKPEIALFSPDTATIIEEAFDDRGRLFLQALREVTTKTGYTLIRPEHVGLALLGLEDGVSQKGLLIQLKDPKRIYQEVMHAIQQATTPDTEVLTLDKAAMYRPVLRILTLAAEISQDDGRLVVGESQLLRALLSEGQEGLFGNILRQFGVNFSQLVNYAAANPESKVTIKKPVQNPWEELKSRFGELESFLKSRIIGQEQAIQVLIVNLVQAIFGPRIKADQPVGVLFFAGPTGVGKTEIARVLAEFVFGSPETLVRIDMSEYMQSHSDARLTGPPPGYVGHEEGGQLSNKILENPFAIILFDEVEKAHSSIFNIFLQIFSAARLTDGKGREVKFHNTLIIATSNVGAQQAEMVGEPARRQAIYEQAFIDTFTPEIRNRFSHVVYFNSLPKEACRQILSLNINQLIKAYDEQKKISVSFSEEILEFLLDKGFDPEMGARPLARTIENLVNAKLSMEIAYGRIKEGDPVHFDVTGEKVVCEPRP